MKKHRLIENNHNMIIGFDLIGVQIFISMSDERLTLYTNFTIRLASFIE